MLPFKPNTFSPLDSSSYSSSSSFLFHTLLLLRFRIAQLLNLLGERRPRIDAPTDWLTGFKTEWGGEKSLFPYNYYILLLHSCCSFRFQSPCCLLANFGKRICLVCLFFFSLFLSQAGLAVGYGGPFFLPLYIQSSWNSDFAFSSPAAVAATSTSTILDYYYYMCLIDRESQIADYKLY